MKRIIILGSTGSIGESTLDVVRKNPDKLKVCGLSTKGNVELLQRQIEEFKPERVSIGGEGLLDLVRMPADLVVCALVGSVGLRPVLEAIRSGKDVALANKEALVMAGEILMSEARRMGVNIIPIDSEHSAIMQCLWKRSPAEVRRLILTASGGPFYNREDLSCVTPQEALQHPTWQMGPKVTVDSATLMNKGFEVIEAHFLFGIPVDRIDVLIHPESIVHAMVEFIDGSVVALMHMPDMRIPIQYALSWPQRWVGDYGILDLAEIKTLNFIKPDLNRFPALELAYKSVKIGGTMPAMLSVADEVYVDKFLNGEIGFTDIIRNVRYVVEHHKPIMDPTIEDILEITPSRLEKNMGSVPNF